MFKALGDPTRLRIFDFLRRRSGAVAVESEDGAIRSASAGDICCYVTGTAGPITSTVSHHLKELRLAELIFMERCGKRMLCRVNPEAIAELAMYLTQEMQEEVTSCC